VCGGRDFKDKNWIRRQLQYLDETKGIDLIIHGCASGADSISGEWAKSHAIPVREFPADWDKYGKAAGPIRNKQMLTESEPDAVLAFPGGKGTANMIKQATEFGIDVLFSRE
jgi:YspA, cpYpsA-related SLOG family